MSGTALLTNPQTLADEIRQRARNLGFDLVGIADASPSKWRGYWENWLAEGRHGSMQYLARRLDERTDPGTYLPGARSVICVAMNYHVPLDAVPDDQKQFHAKISRYALGDDYHEFMKSRLYQLADWLKTQAPEAVTKCCV